MFRKIPKVECELKSEKENPGGIILEEQDPFDQSGSFSSIKSHKDVLSKKCFQEVLF
jgi:hypothetical protein